MHDSSQDQTRPRCSTGFERQEDARSSRRQLTEAKGRGTQSAPPVPTSPHRAAALPSPTGLSPSKTIDITKSIKRWMGHPVNASPSFGAGTLLHWQPFYPAPNAAPSPLCTTPRPRELGRAWNTRPENSFRETQFPKSRLKAAHHPHLPR